MSGDVSADGVAMAIRSELPPLQRPQWIPDERDGFISWLRGEFAAANAIIDALCQHLQGTGLPGEYDLVLACIQQRRFNWNPILHMQQYFSVAEVLMALQQVIMKKHHQAASLMPKSTVQDNSLMKPMKPSESPKREEESGFVIEEASQDMKSGKNEDPLLASKVSSLSIAEEASNSFHAANSRKCLVGFEVIEGEQVNVLEGLELHENVLDGSVAADLTALVNKYHAGSAGAAKRSAAIQFGTIPSDILASEEKSNPERSSDQTMEGCIPTFLEGVVEHLVNLKVISADRRPDSCSICILEPGDNILLQSYHKFEQPMYILSLGSESLLTFGRNVKMRSTGEAGLFSMTLPVGSLLVLQGKSLELVQLAVSASHTFRALVTFGKSKALSMPTEVSPQEKQRSSPNSRRGDGGHGGFHGGGYQQSVSPPPAVLSPARSPVPAAVGHFPHSPAWSSSSVRVPPTSGTGVFLPANGNAATIFSPTQPQMNGFQRRQVLSPPQFFPQH